MCERLFVGRDRHKLRYLRRILGLNDDVVDNELDSGTKREKCVKTRKGVYQQTFARSHIRQLHHRSSGCGCSRFGNQTATGSTLHMPRLERLFQRTSKELMPYAVGKPAAVFESIHADVTGATAVLSSSP